jgi:hypothetical protein
MANTLGINDKVCSFICVAACKMLITNPVIKDTNSSGADTINIVSSACCPRLSTVWLVIIRDASFVGIAGIF